MLSSFSCLHSITGLLGSHWGNMPDTQRFINYTPLVISEQTVNCKHTPVKWNKSVTLVYNIFVLVYHNLYFLRVRRLRLAFFLGGGGVQHTISSSIQRIVPFTAD